MFRPALTGFVAVHHEVTDEVNDSRMHYPMAKAAKDLLAREHLTVVADTGFSNGNVGAAREADGITTCVRPIARSTTAAIGVSLTVRTSSCTLKPRCTQVEHR
ncbi:MAG: hypothetical protein GEV13_31445 [Rhodospirillales bacterium]|nr:hypothetical protein [Rhodospirillales bacterium]